MIEMRKPNRLHPGSQIAVVSPCGGAPHRFPGVFELGLRNLRSLGLEIKELPTARMSPKALYRHPELRAKDLNDAFADPAVDGVICSIGGYESVRILPYLDTKVILENTKLLMGFSDATTFLAYLNELGLVTFYGPSVMAGFAQMKHLPPTFEAHVRKFFFEPFESYAYKPYPEWTNGYRDWGDAALLGQCTAFYKNDGWTFLQGNGPVEGVLWGGCIEILELLKSTEYYPRPEFWKGKILFFETSEDKPLPMQVGYMLRNYGMQGVFQKVNGLIFGRPKDYTAAECDELRRTIRDVIGFEFGAPELPVLFGADFGHTDPKVILPLGCRMRLNPADGEFRLLENPFRQE